MGPVTTGQMATAAHTHTCSTGWGDNWDWDSIIVLTACILGNGVYTTTLWIVTLTEGGRTAMAVLIRVGSCISMLTACILGNVVHITTIWSATLTEGDTGGGCICLLTAGALGDVVYVTRRWRDVTHMDESVYRFRAWLRVSSSFNHTSLFFWLQSDSDSVVFDTHTHTHTRL